jgi:hypothetical protein
MLENRRMVMVMGVRGLGWESEEERHVRLVVVETWKWYRQGICWSGTVVGF